MRDVAEVISTSRLPLGQIYRQYPPKNMAGTPAIIERSYEFDGVEKRDD